MPVFFQFASVDRYITEAAAKEHFSAAGEPKTQGWYYCSHEFNDLQSARSRAVPAGASQARAGTAADAPGSRGRKENSLSRNV